MPDSSKFDLLAARLEAAKRDAMVQLNRDMFALTPNVPAKPLPRWWFLQRRWMRVTAYLRTLWLALKGRELVEADDWDY